MISPVSDTALTLRQAARRMRYVSSQQQAPPSWEIALADLLDETSERAQATYEVIQAPSRGIDQPPAIAYGDPERAERIVAGHHATILRVARGILGGSGAFLGTSMEES